MSQQRANPRAQALARICENLAYALPPYRDLLHDQLRHLTGFADHTPGAAPATVTASRPLEGKCTQPVAWPPATRWGQAPQLIDCGRTRPCPEHDRPVTLTPTEACADQRQRLKAELADIDQTLDTVVYLINELLQRARRHAPLTPVTVPLCNGGQGRDGWMIPREDGGWSDLACRRPAERNGGICSACYMRERRYREKVGLPPRDREGEVSYNV